MSSAAPRARYKKGRTTRLKAKATADGLPLSLTGRDIEVKLALDDDAATVVTLSIGSGVTILNAGNGEFAWDVSAANLATLGNPDNVFTVVNIWNADNTLAMEKSDVIEVAL